MSILGVTLACGKSIAGCRISNTFRLSTPNQPVRIISCARQAVELAQASCSWATWRATLRRSLAHILRRVLGARGALAQHLPQRALQRGAQGPPVARAPPGAGRARAAAGCIDRICTSSISLSGTTPLLCVQHNQSNWHPHPCSPPLHAVLQYILGTPGFCSKPCAQALQQLPA